MVKITKEKFQFTYKQHNGLKPHKFIDVFNQRTGRIKRMRLNNGVTKVFKSKHRRYGKKLSDKISFYQWTYPTITRWNRH